MAGHGVRSFRHLTVDFAEVFCELKANHREHRGDEQKQQIPCGNDKQKAMAMARQKQIPCG
jgi:hypothetical protein